MLLVGTHARVKRYLTNLSTAAGAVLLDHDFFWVLTDSSEAAAHELPHVQHERTVVLNWQQAHQNVIHSQLQLLARHSELIGLSRELNRVRREIERLAIGKKGPWSPVLILGESGSGKEEVAKALFLGSDRARTRPGSRKDGKPLSRFIAIPCGWFSETLLRAQLFGSRAFAYTGSADKPGLLVRHSDGAVLIDDLDSSPQDIQAALLRVLATPRGTAADVERLGDVEATEKTNVWLMFTTNVSIETLLEEKKIREDFIFRFEDRVIHIPPLRRRVADLPALVHHLWDAAWNEREQDGLAQQRRPITPPVLEWLLTAPNEWKGNVRALRALLRLVVSAMTYPGNNPKPIQELLAAILRRGPEYKHWVGIVYDLASVGDADTEDHTVAEVLELDARDECRGPPILVDDQLQKTGSEKDAARWLSAEGQAAFDDVLSACDGKRVTSKHVRPSVRVSRIICYVGRKGGVEIETAARLGQIGHVTAGEDLNTLVRAGLLSRRKVDRKWRYSKTQLVKGLPDSVPTIL
jgi:DNA-binding NtrC family response regulator